MEHRIGASAISVAAVAALLLAFMTASSTGCKTPEEEVITGIDNLPGGNPLVPQVALYPFPSDFYLVDDATTATGRRISLPPEGMPTDLTAERFEHIDGFSRVGALLTFLDGGVDPASLPDLNDPSAAMDDDSAVWLIEEGSWERRPALVEMDASANGASDQALIIRPVDTLAADTGHVVLIRDHLLSADGASHPTPTEAFRALRDGIPTDCDEVESQRDDFERVLQAIDEQGLAPETVVAGWSFHTRSAEQLHAPLLGMQDIAATAAVDDWQIDSDQVEDDNRVIRGTFSAPDFLGADEWVALDEGGAPVVHGEREVPFQITIPDTIGDETRPVVAFGHGFFSSPEEPTWSSLNRGMHTWRMSAVTTEFIGFNEDDFSASLAILAGDLDSLWIIVSQQMQSHVHFTMLSRLVTEELATEIVSDDGTAVLDGDLVHYMGISNGGTQGFVLMTASPVFTRGALVVPGGGWTHMLQRAAQWNDMGQILAIKYTDPLELQLMMSLLQLHFDSIDAANWVQHLVHDRLPGRPDVQVTLHEAVGDCQVANFLTEWMARTAQIPLITPSPYEVWGLDTLSAEPPDGADSNSALIIYDEGYPPLPEGNIPPEENGAHGSVRELDVYVEQVGTFLETGTIVQVCDGACDPD